MKEKEVAGVIYCGYDFKDNRLKRYQWLKKNCTKNNAKDWIKKKTNGNEGETLLKMFVDLSSGD